MPPKVADKKPSIGGKAPAGKAPVEKKEAGKKTAAPTGDKKKRNKTRKETYSSYIYKGNMESKTVSHKFVPFSLTRPSSSEASPPRYRYFQSCHVHPELICQWYAEIRPPSETGQSLIRI